MSILRHYRSRFKPPIVLFLQKHAFRKHMKVIVVKYNAGNTTSVINALARLGVEAEISNEVKSLQNADRVIFPGVGEARSAIEYLHSHNLGPILKELTVPVLGICLGLALFCSHSEERDVDCLSIFPEKVKKFDDTLKVPHVGWNHVESVLEHDVAEKNLSTKDLFNGITNNSPFYFTHSYYAELGSSTIGTTEYNITFGSVLRNNNFYAVQFHPEKSGTVGEKLLSNFLSL
jgi:imidazole glycerol-phosphate synthase subunit HisH